MNDRWESSLWIMNADGTRTRFLVKGSDAQWSPDGPRIAYVARGRADGGVADLRALDGRRGRDDADHAPHRGADRPRVVAGRQVRSRSRCSCRRRQLAHRDARRAEGREVDRGAARRDEAQLSLRPRQGFIEDGYRHLFVVPADGGTPRQVTSGDVQPRRRRAGCPTARRSCSAALRMPDAEYAWRRVDIYAADVDDAARSRQLTPRQRAGRATRVRRPTASMIAYTRLRLHRRTRGRTRSST